MGNSIYFVANSHAWLGSKLKPIDAMNTDISIFYFTVNENPLLIG